MDKVYVENDWYDGPRNGITDFKGSPHRFLADFEDFKGDLDIFKLFPISKEELKLEIEQWNIFVEWNNAYEAGETETDSHPAHGGLNQRWDELECILSKMRKIIPETAMKARANFINIDQACRYENTGPDYGVVWEIISENT